MSVNSHGTSNGASRYPSLSNHGGYVAFVSDASDLTANDRNREPDVFLADRRAAKVRLVSVRDEMESTEALPAISADGRFVAFTARLKKKPTFQVLSSRTASPLSGLGWPWAH